ncbi:MAG: hypothetical protein M1828_003335 [Chrysothrix sp. TS-e1954]|nr:MAG: hypothetical protein M1828_003335 [Chrysothrix sp. TS-e1954]
MGDDRQAKGIDPRDPASTIPEETTTEPESYLNQRQSSPGRGTIRQPRPLHTFRMNTEPPRNVVSPEPTSPADTRSRKKPTLSRRSSAKHVPFRGQEFSVDDATREVNHERSASRATGSLHRTPSTIRRRPTGMTSRVPFAETADEEVREDHQNPLSRSATISETIHAPGEAPAKDTGGTDGKLDNDGDRRKGDDAEDEDNDANDEDGNGEDGDGDDDDDDDGDISDAESFTLKDRQEAINETHPFGIRIWKPALYKKGRSVEKDAEGDIHSAPGGNVSRWLLLFNFAWTLIFGWWLALFAGIGGLLCHIFVLAPGCTEYGTVLWGFARYIFYPFGKYVKLIQEEAYADEDAGEARSISEYEQWQNGDLEEGRLFFGPVRPLIGRRRDDDESDDDESSSLLGRERRGHRNSTSKNRTKRRLFGRGEWNVGRVIFFVVFYGFLMPLLLLVSGICWLLVFTIPMGRVTNLLLYHLRHRPLALEFHADTTYTRAPGAPPSSIILCTYRAVGTKYWKYTIDGTNVFLINLLGVVAFVIFDYWVLYTALGIKSPVTNTIFLFLLSLFSIIPLAYFIGQAVASISAQSTMGVGAAVNAFFSTIVEVFLYCVALNEGKSRLVEGSLIGSIFAGILLLPGISMCFGAIKRKTQRFNVKSAGVTSTMLLFATIGAFGPTLFYQIYGASEINCHQCTDEDGKPLDRDCRRCFFSQVPAVDDPFFEEAVRPYCYFAALLLFLSYVIGLLFTLRTHAATIWNTELDEKKMEKMDGAVGRVANDGGPHKSSSQDYGSATPPSNITPTSTLTKTNIRDSQLYKRILGQSLRQAGIGSPHMDGADESPILRVKSPPLPERPVQQKRQSSLQITGMSAEDSQAFVRSMAEMAATAAAVATRDATAAPRKASHMAKTSMSQQADVRPAKIARINTAGLEESVNSLAPPTQPPTAGAAMGDAPVAGGHDAPNWGRVKSYTILLSATLAYAVIAEILVSTVDAVLENVDIDEKFLGITLFALVPNTTEFLNAISFAMNGNIALSMEIGSAYALQVCLLQIPALVLFSAVNGQFMDPSDIVDHTFTLLFPQWDMVTVILCVFLLSYMYGEGKSNYFKGSILILSYLVVIVGFYLTGFDYINASDPDGISDRYLAPARYRVMGSRNPPAF